MPNIDSLKVCLHANKYQKPIVVVIVVVGSDERDVTYRVGFLLLSRSIYPYPYNVQTFRTITRT